MKVSSMAVLAKLSQFCSSRPGRLRLSGLVALLCLGASSWAQEPPLRGARGRPTRASFGRSQRCRTGAAPSRASARTHSDGPTGRGQRVLAPALQSKMISQMKSDAARNPFDIQTVVCGFWTRVIARDCPRAARAPGATHARRICPEFGVKMSSPRAGTGGSNARSMASRELINFRNDADTIRQRGSRRRDLARQDSRANRRRVIKTTCARKRPRGPPAKWR